MTDIVRIGTVTFAQSDSGSSPLTTFSHTLAPGANRVLYVYINSSSTTAATFTVTYGGFTVANVSSQRLGSANLNQDIRQLEEFSLDQLTNDAHDVVVSWTGGANMQLEVTVEAGANIQQIGGQTADFSTVNNAVEISNETDATADTWAVSMVICQDNGETFVHNNSQNEIRDNSTFTGFSGAITSTIYSSLVTTDFQSEKTGSNDRMMRFIQVRLEEPITIVEFESTTNVVSTVIGALEQRIAATVNVVSGSTIALQRDRGYVTSLAVTAVVTPALERAARFQSVTNIASTVTGQAIERAANFKAVVNPIADVTGLFGATRPLAAITNAAAVITAQFGSDFEENRSSLTPGAYIELYEIDTTVIGGSDVFRFVTQGYTASNIFWQGEEFTRFPIEIEGFEWNATAQAPPQPTLRLSNVNKFVLAAVITLGDLVGAKVTRWRTYSQFLDNQPQADPNAHFPPDIFFIQQKTIHSKLMMEWSLTSALDLPGNRLPGRQILRDQTTGNAYAPGVSQVRFRGR